MRFLSSWSVSAWSARPSLLRLCAIAAAFAPTCAFALGTPAGTAIQSTAHVSYADGGVNVTVVSNSPVVTVAEILNVNVTVQTPTVSVAPGATQRAVVVRVTNTGNGTETFALAGESVLAGDDFDPTPTAPFIYFDTDGSGDLSAADVPYSAGNNDPVLDADQFVTLLIVNNIPNALPNGAQGRTQLTATALTGSGAPGTVYAGAGVGGVDAMVGTSGATQIGVGAYVIAGLQISAVKSQTVVDPFGGARPIPGARINYRIIVTPTGSGSVLGVAFTDAIPANTTYVADSMQLNGVTLTDATGDDAGEFTSSPAQVRVTFGDLTNASGAQIIDFAVTIN